MNEGGRSYENKSIVADGARVHLGNSITADELEEYQGGG